MAGQTAAFVLGNFFVNQDAKVGVVLGDYAFSCHEDREIGFRSRLRANFPNIAVKDVARADDSPIRTYEAVRELLQQHPEINGLYNVVGGNASVTQAIRESKLSEGLIQYLISQYPSKLFRRAIEIAAMQLDQISREMNFIDFGVYMRFNLSNSHVGN